ncbi:hypothetical protein FQA47_021046 [Oryzias melastigma]|uniref:Secreted protein n=1 Tax=Oryzias melastigma TaxID=30732 RepID=A0A834FEP2_ORYME|nr:hypothetical protein FQA47_021046 [Oryzias melastigma]
MLLLFNALAAEVLMQWGGGGGVVCVCVWGGGGTPGATTDSSIQPGISQSREGGALCLLRAEAFSSERAPHMHAVHHTCTPCTTHAHRTGVCLAPPPYCSLFPRFMPVFKSRCSAFRTSSDPVPDPNGDERTRPMTKPDTGPTSRSHDHMVVTSRPVPVRDTVLQLPAVRTGSRMVTGSSGHDPGLESEPSLDSIRVWTQSRVWTCPGSGLRADSGLDPGLDSEPSLDSIRVWTQSRVSSQMLWARSG